MLDEILSIAANLPDVWGEGALFAFSGMDGATDVVSGFVATFAAQPYDLLFHTPRRRRLTIALEDVGAPRVATNDVLAVETSGGPLVYTFSAWHTLTGVIPTWAEVRFSFETGERAEWADPCWVTEDRAAGDALVFIEQKGRFALAYGRTVDEAQRRARAGMALDLTREVVRRLDVYRTLPARPDPGADRLLKKCFSVMKVNTLAPEGALAGMWSTPDRAPHRDMWLWDSAFHAVGMSCFRPELAWAFLKAVLDAQNPDGMIAHQVSVTGAKSAITQPPVLAWAVWETYCALRDRAGLEYALPRLERYLEWDLTHRDRNGNGLLEWFIEENEKCRSGESGMDNSPRFDAALIVDAVDFSTFLAHDMAHVARIAAELGQDDRAQAWQARAQAVSERIYRDLWCESEAFYLDRDLDGRFSTIRAASGFLPLLLDDIPSGHVEALVNALRDPALFNTAFPVPSVAVSDPAWSTDMWRGPTWINLNYLIVEGLRKHGKTDEADWLAAKTVAHVRKYYEQYGVIFEFYDFKDETPPPVCDRKGPRRKPYDIRRKYDSIRDLHWSAALTARLLTKGLPHG